MLAHHPDRPLTLHRGEYFIDVFMAPFSQELEPPGKPGTVQCRFTFEMGVKHTKWDKPTESLLELVADNRAD